MALNRECPAFDNFGKDVKEARQALKLSRSAFAEQIGIVPRYLANIENSGKLPNLPIFYDIVMLCKLPIEKYFYPEAGKTVSNERERVKLKLELCSEKYLPIVEATIDGAINVGEADNK